MAENKNGFILYADYHEMFATLSDQEAGKLIKHILAYVNDKSPEEPEDKLIKILFNQIKLQLKRDLRKWEDVKKKRSEAGRLGGLASAESRSKSKQTLESSTTVNDSQANQAVNVNVNVNDIDIEPEANQANVEFASPLQTLPQPEIHVAPPAAPVDRSLLGVVVYDAEQSVISNQIEFERICMVTKTSRQNALESLRLYHLHLQEKERYPMGKKAVFAGFEKWLMDPYGFSKEAKNRKNSNQDTQPVKQFNGGGLAKMRAIQKEYEEKVKREAGNG